MLEVGPDRVKYCDHKALLVHHSEYFRNALGGSWEEAKAALIVLEEIEPATCTCAFFCGDPRLICSLKSTSSCTGYTTNSFLTNAISKNGHRSPGRLTATRIWPRSKRTSLRTDSWLSASGELSTSTSSVATAWGLDLFWRSEKCWN